MSGRFAGLLTRNSIRTVLRNRSAHATDLKGALKLWPKGGHPGNSVPFRIDSKIRLTALFSIFFGIGFVAPFFILRYAMVKRFMV